MDLRDYCNILLFVIASIYTLVAQTTDVRCINPEFDVLVDKTISHSIPVISVADAYEKKDKVVFLDARELEEYNTSHINRAIHIGYRKFNIESIKTKVSKEETIIIYCSIGYRSEKIGEILKENGFQNVYNLYGSIFEWVNQHHPVVDQNGDQTSNVHTYNKKWSKWVANKEANKVWD